MNLVRNLENHSHIANDIAHQARGMIVERAAREEDPVPACFEAWGNSSYLILDQAIELLGSPVAQDNHCVVWRFGSCIVYGGLERPNEKDPDDESDEDEDDQNDGYLTPYVGINKVRLHGPDLCGPPAEVKALKERIEKILLKVPRPKEQLRERGVAHMLISTLHGPQFRGVGQLGCELTRENYSAEVLAGFDSIVQSIQAEEPCGRLSILNGPPGTGKTRMVRGMLYAILDAVHVLIPAKEVEKLGDPEMLTSLLELQNDSGGPGTRLVLYLEDADQALVPRDANSLAVISTLLNATDGMLGALLNLYVVATTNQTVAKIDDAIKRPGRMDVQMRLGALPAEQATSVFRRIAPGTTFTYNREQTLAEIYADAVRAIKEQTR